jgi:lipopolysaccharide assembly outer membrane protein LptD (OstA)
MKRLLALATFAALLGAGAPPAKSPPAKPTAAQKPTPAASANPPGSLPGEFSNVGGFDSITTRSIDTNLNTGVFSVPQHFTASRADTQISADKATGNTRTKVVHATGNVIVHRTAPIQGTGDSRIGPEPSTLTCDKLDIDGGKKFYMATGNVHFTQGTRDATADRGTLDEVTGLLHLSGNVHIRDKEQYLDGDDVVYNTKTGDVRATGNPVMVRAPAATPVPTDEGLTPTATPKPKKR